MEGARQQTQTALAQAQKLAQLGYYRWWRPQQRLLSYNEEYLKILGGDLESIAEHLPGIEPFLHTEVRQRVIQAHRAAEVQGKGFHLEFLIVRPDGAIRHLLGLSEPESASGDPPDIWSRTVQKLTLQKPHTADLPPYMARLELALTTPPASHEK